MAVPGEQRPGFARRGEQGEVRRHRKVLAKAADVLERARDRIAVLSDTIARLEAMADAENAAEERGARMFMEWQHNRGCRSPEDRAYRMMDLTDWIAERARNAKEQSDGDAL